MSKRGSGFAADFLEESSEEEYGFFKISKEILRNYGGLLMLKLMKNGPILDTDIRYEFLQMMGKRHNQYNATAVKKILESLYKKDFVTIEYIPLSLKSKRFRRMVSLTERGREYMEAKQLELDTLYFMIRDYGMEEEERRITEEIRQERLSYKAQVKPDYWNEINEVSD